LRALRAPTPEILLTFGGIAERVAWTMLQPAHGAMGEAMNVAIALGEGRGFAGAYGPGHGATAHLLPAGPALAGLVYHWLAPRSAAAEAILASWSIGLAVGSYLLLYRAFGHLRVPRPARLAGLGVGMLVPAYFTIETVDFRVWEGGLATFLAALFLERVLAAHRSLLPHVTRFPLAPIASACLLFFVNPPLGVSAFVCLIVLGLTKLPMRANIVGALIALGLLAIAIGPWAMRNERALGAFVPLRSNAGLELALANNPEMAAATDENAALERRLLAIHPTANLQARREVMQIGEVAYANRRGAETKAWIAAHPSVAAWLWLRHARQMLVPDRWITDARHSRAGAIRAIFLQAVGVGGLLGLVLIARRRRDAAVYPAVMLLFTTLLLMPFQPVSRYTYVLYPTLCFLLAGLSLVRRTPCRNGSGACQLMCETDQANADRVRTAAIGGMTIARLRRDELAALMQADVQRARSGELAVPRIVTSANGSVVAAYNRDADYRQLMDGADIIDADGMPIVFASRLFCREPLEERTATTDFLLDAAELAARTNLRFFFLGSRPGVAARAAEHLRSRFPGLKVVGVRHGFFPPEAAADICERVRASGADILWVGMGSPAQEQFAVHNKHLLGGVAWIRTCGGLFDHYGGGVSRAPRWMQTAGLEWLYRAAREPMRLGWRYLVTSPVAIYYLATRTRD
jgi:N-acetylglucosaminyldiphosphoundecaprenol N-acetyl-beta-D-mannosaminyltransferase